jgi:aspartyl-tRNA(Asn)/glutamyl-tRNA(Gln) amidotransferase subunit A
MAGLPGISVPAGFSDDGLPLGLQIIGRPFDEETVLRAGQLIEEAAGRFPSPEPWWRSQQPAATKRETSPSRKKSKASAKS